MRPFFPFRTSSLGKPVYPSKVRQYDRLRTWQILHESQMLEIAIEDHKIFEMNIKEIMSNQALLRKYEENLKRLNQYNNEILDVYEEIDPHFAYCLGFKNGFYCSTVNKFK